MSRAAAFLVAGLISGCSAFDPECGLLSGEPGIFVHVTDAASGRLLSEGIEVVARDGDFAEVLVGYGVDYVGLFGRPGTYTVTASGDGYREASAAATVGVLECGGDEYVRQTLAEITLTSAAK